ncbi:MAG TPA: F0F1 ATP synthase subunit epsilon [Armatimonadota bacterium]|nr:F0F1 ATP synthase subunit epsilon [Armatimonadota bacterium]
MPNNHFTVEIVSADRKLYSGEAVSITIPGADGYFGVLRGHAPLVSAMMIGEITITPPDNKPPIIFAVSGGFAEVSAEHVVILADTAELAEEIDVERARLAKERAEERLQEAGGDIDVTRAQAALMRAINRLRVATRRGL